MTSGEQHPLKIKFMMSKSRRPTISPTDEDAGKAKPTLQASGGHESGSTSR